MLCNFWLRNCHLVPSAIHRSSMKWEGTYFLKSLDYVTIFVKALSHSGNGSIKFGADGAAGLGEKRMFVGGILHPTNIFHENDGITFSSNAFFFPLFFFYFV